MTADERQAGLDRLNQSFMVPEIWRGDCWEVSADHGSTYYVDAGVAGTDPTCLQDYVEGRIDVDDDGAPIATLHRGVYMAQLSAPGYLDCTDLTMHATRKAAEAYLVETYDDGESDDE